MSSTPPFPPQDSHRSRSYTNSNTASGSSRRLHRTPTGRIARARSTSALTFTDLNRRAIWEAAINLDYRSHPTGSTPDSEAYVSVSSVADPALYLQSEAPVVPLSPRPAYSEPLPSLSEEVAPADTFFAQYFPTITGPEDFSSMEAVMSGQYGNYSYASYPSSYATTYSGAESQQPTVTSSPAPSYPSYVSSPQTSHTSPAPTHATSSQRLPSMLTSRYQAAMPNQYDQTAAAQAAAYSAYGAHAGASQMQPGYAAGYPGPAELYDASSHPAYQGQPQYGYTQTPYTQYAEGSQTQGIALAGGVTSGSRVVAADKKPQCWDHGCAGREFSTFSNLLRHQREKSGTAAKSECPRCGAKFTRTTARNGHIQHDKCKGKRGSGKGSDGE